MYTIHLNSTNEELSFYKFSDRFLQICNDHKNENKALAFAFILYDFQNPQISKILNDVDYWHCLNEISGKYLTVFSFHYKPKKRFRIRTSSQGFNSTEYMTAVSTYNNPSEETNKLIERYFGEIEIKYPSVLFFQIDSEKIVDYTLIQLDEEQIEVAFSELKKYINSAVAALRLIENENKQNHKEIFEQLSENVNSVRSLTILKRKLKNITSISDFASSIIKWYT